MKRSVALYGLSGSGKSTVAEMMVKRGYQHIKTGAACREICQLLFGSDAKTILNQVTDQMRAIDPTVWLRAALRTTDSSMPIVFDSMRFGQDYEYMHTSGFYLVRLEVRQDTRLERLRQRGQTYNAALDDLHEAEIELFDQQFDLTLDNNHSRDSLERQVADMCASLEEFNN